MKKIFTIICLLLAFFAISIIQQIHVRPFPVMVKFFSWPNDGSKPADGFKFEGEFYIEGVFSGTELNKVEIQINRCTE